MVKWPLMLSRKGGNVDGFILYTIVFVCVCVGVGGGGPKFTFLCIGITAINLYTEIVFENISTDPTGR